MSRLEFIAAVRVENFAENITNLLQRFKIIAVFEWSDSIVVLHLLKENSTYKQFVQNQIDHKNSKVHV